MIIVAWITIGLVMAIAINKQDPISTGAAVMLVLLWPVMLVISMFKKF